MEKKLWGTYDENEDMRLDAAEVGKLRTRVKQLKRGVKIAVDRMKDARSQAELERTIYDSNIGSWKSLTAVTGIAALAAGVFLSHQLYTHEIQPFKKELPPVDSSYVIDTPAELNDFTRMRGFIDLKRFQEQIHYQKGADTGITGEPDAASYIWANVIRARPELKDEMVSEWLTADGEYHTNYIDREISLQGRKYKFVIPAIALKRFSKIGGNAIDYKDPIVKGIAAELTGGLKSDVEKAKRIYEFVRLIPGQTSHSDTKHPLVTLADWNGDNRDDTILYVSLARAAGLKPAVVTESDGHMVAGIKGVGIRGWYLGDEKTPEKDRIYLVDTSFHIFGHLAEKYAKTSVASILQID